MVKAETGKEVASDSRSDRKKSKKIKRKSTFYSFPAHSDNEVSEELPAPVPEPVPLETEDKSPENANDVDVTDNVDSVDNYDLNFHIKTRKSESHWYMIYYDGSIEITDDEDSDDVKKPSESVKSELQPSSGCIISSNIQGDKKEDEMVSDVIFSNNV